MSRSLSTLGGLKGLVLSSHRQKAQDEEGLQAFGSIPTVFQPSLSQEFETVKPAGSCALLSTLTDA